uniref:type III-A CRISPR-associated protein Csm2 n=1 Tax=Anaerobutyricum hallii TaxID=39488 RepID=UPI003FEEA30C
MGLTSENYVDEAERVIKTLIEKDRSGRDVIRLTTSKIRGILSLVTELYNDIIHEPSNKLGEEYVERIQYLRLRIAYEAGRDKLVAEFVRKSNLLGYVKQIKDNKKLFLLFTKYVEALVAYHKYYGGKDA